MELSSRLSENIVSVDIGTSSVRAFLFDRDFNSCEGIGVQKKYELTTAADGTVEVSPVLLLQLVSECLDVLHEQMEARNLRAAAVAISTFWHCFLGLDRDGVPTTSVVHLFDTRSGEQMRELTNTFDPGWIHAVTGCMPHTSYWPAKFLWLRKTRPEFFERTSQWRSPGAFLLQTFTGTGNESCSMTSASGIWDQRKFDYCEELLDAIQIKRAQLAPVESLDEPSRSLLPAFAPRWPIFNGIPWLPPYGDGACNSVGSGCTNPKRFALMIGTTGAMRVVIKQNNVTIPFGTWCYRVNRDRVILGGATSNGGEVFRWATRTFNLPPDAEEQIAKREPGSHGLTILPFLAGERSPYWRPELRATITGMSLATQPVDVLQAALESVALRFKQIFTLLTRPFPAPEQVVASGGALLRSTVWSQIMADALGQPLTASLVREASSRGAALIAAERLGIIASLDDVAAETGTTVYPSEGKSAIYKLLLERDNRLFEALHGVSAISSARLPFSAFEHKQP